MANWRNFFKQYVFDKYLNAGIIAIIDIMMSLVATLITLAALDFIIPDYSMPLIVVLKVSAINIIATLIAILIMRTHRIIIRHSSIADTWKFGIVTIIKSTIMGLFAFFIFKYQTPILAVALLFEALITACMLICIRIAMIIVYNHIKRSIISDPKRHNIFIYGSSEKSTALKMRLENSPHYKVIGFIRYQSLQSESKLAGVKLISFHNKSKEDIAQIFIDNGISDVLFPNYSSLREESDRLVNFCMEHNIRILVAPPIDEAVEGNIPHSAIRAVKIEDLLGREEINISMEEIKANFADKTILITGAAGSIGSELCRQLASIGVKRLVLFDNAETPMHYIRLELEDKFKNVEIIPIIGDVRQLRRLEYLFNRYSPQAVFHAAAYKHVPLMEDNPCEAALVNVVGSRNVADMCIKYNVETMVMISTDKAVNPTNVMGCSKRLAEIYVQALGTAIANGKMEGKTRFVTTRFGNVLGSNGSVIPRFREQIIAGGPVTVTHPDITRFFMTIPEACRLVMEAAAMSKGNQIFVFDMGKSVKIVDLAKKMIELAGFKVGRDIEIKFTGLRPGEKLYEEVLANNENTIETDHHKIRIAKVRQYEYADAVEYVDKLQTLAHNIEITDTVKLMKEIVPEFKSQNSKFESLDK